MYCACAISSHNSLTVDGRVHQYKIRLNCQKMYICPKMTYIAIYYSTKILLVAALFAVLLSCFLNGLIRLQMAYNLLVSSPSGSLVILTVRMLASHLATLHFSEPGPSYSSFSSEKRKVATGRRSGSSVHSPPCSRVHHV